MTDSVVISHDGFARWELHRRVARDRRERHCTWCGQCRLSRTGKELALFEYSTVSDSDLTGSRAAVHKGLFCSKPCHDAYHS